MLSWAGQRISNSGASPSRASASCARPQQRSTSPRNQLRQQLKPLSRHPLVAELADPREVAARPGEAGDQTKLDRVFGDTEDNRDRRCRSFGRKRGGVVGRGDHGDTTADQVSH